MKHANWSYPTPIRFGVGRLAELAEVCDEHGINRPLFVTDRGLADLDMTREAIESIRSGKRTVSVFSDVHPNPREQDVLRGVQSYREGGCDGVIGFGGGSALDTAKSVAFLQGQTRPIWDFEDVGDWWTRADADRIAPVIAIPTTAGTGSEVGRATVVTNEDTHEKKIIFHPKMMPVAVISDPAVTVGLPPALTVGAGMDAFAHCFEAWCAPTYHPMSAGIALEGMRLVAMSLPRVFEDGTDLSARADMMTAASMGAVAFQKGLGAIHSLSHPIGARYHTHHGMTNAVFLPYVLHFNREYIQEKINPMCDALQIGSGFRALLDWTLSFRERLNVAHTIDQLGVDDTHASWIAEQAEADPSTGTNPRPFDRAAALRVFRASLSGDISAAD